MVVIDTNKIIEKKKEVEEIFSNILNIVKAIYNMDIRDEIKEQLGFLYERGKEDGITNLFNKFRFFLEEL